MTKPKLSKRSTQYFDIQLQDLINTIGEDDLKDFPGIKREVQKAYKLRRLKLIELEKELKNLLNTDKVTKEIRKDVTSLVREIKTIIVTDPTETFKYDPTKLKKDKSKFKNILNIGGKQFDGWFQTTQKWYTVNKPTGAGDAHHKGGLDDTFRSVLNKSDSELLFLHRDLLKIGRALGNHMLNRIFFRKGPHVGHGRSGVPRAESAHGLIDLTSPGSDNFMQILDQNIDRRAPPQDWGLQGGRKIFVPLPDPGEFGHTTQQIQDLLDHQYKIADSMPSQIGPPEQLWTRQLEESLTPTQARILKTFVEENPNPNSWLPGTREALAAGDTDTLIQLKEQQKQLKFQDFEVELEKLKQGKKVTFPDHIFKTGSRIKNILIGKTKSGTIARGLGVLQTIDWFDSSEATELKAADFVQGRDRSLENVKEIGFSYLNDLKNTAGVLAKTLPAVTAASQVGSLIAPATTKLAMSTAGAFAWPATAIMFIDSYDNIFHDGKIKSWFKNNDPGRAVELGAIETTIPNDKAVPNYRDKNQGYYKGLAIPSIK